jgi:hypothetical protein
LGLSIARGKSEWHSFEPSEWNAEVERFFAAAKKFDEYLASSEPLHASVEKLFQGPVADVLNHVGQLAMLRRLGGAPIKAENYFVADILAGRCGEDQAGAKFELTEICRAEWYRPGHTRASELGRDSAHFVTDRS